MKLRSTTLGWTLVIGVAVLAGPALAQSSRPLITVGDSVVTLAEVQKRLAHVPAFQLRTLGDSPEQIRRAIAAEFASMELVVLGARADGLDERPDVREKILVRLKDALLDSLRRDVESEEITDAAVKAFYEEHRDEYRAQTRLKLGRIVVKSREQAEQILQHIKTDPEYQKDPVAGWDKLAAERSIDPTTAKRGGNLGFVQPDGTTAHQNVQVSPALFKAALAVGDGQVVPEPIEDEGVWVVLARRGGHVTPERTLAMEAHTIRSMLAKKRVYERIDALRNELRKQYLGEVNETLIDQIDITREGELTPKNRPGTLPHRGHPAAASPRPLGLPGNLR